MALRQDGDGAGDFVRRLLLGLAGDAVAAAERRRPDCDVELDCTEEDGPWAHLARAVATRDAWGGDGAGDGSGARPEDAGGTRRDRRPDDAADAVHDLSKTVDELLADIDKPADLGPLPPLPPRASPSKPTNVISDDVVFPKPSNASEPIEASLEKKTPEKEPPETNPSNFQPVISSVVSTADASFTSSPPSCSMAVDNNAAATRQVATVHPMPGAAAPSLGGGLRLRNFAVDPANIQPEATAAQTAEDGLLSDGSGRRSRSESPEVVALATTWHTAEQRTPEQLQQLQAADESRRSVLNAGNNVTYFADAPRHLAFRYIVLDSRGQETRYLMVSSSQKLIFKLFLPEELSEGLSFDGDGWRDVAYSFFPGEGRPTDLRLFFRNHFGLTIQAKLPEKLADVRTLIDRRSPFVLSNPRVALVNEECIKATKVPFFSFAIHLPAGSLHCVEVSKELNEAVPCYRHITEALDAGKKFVTDEIRAKTITHINAYICMHKLQNVEASRIEGTVKTLSKGMLQIYKNLLDVDPPKYVEYNLNIPRTSITPQQQRQAPVTQPASFIANPSSESDNTTSVTSAPVQPAHAIAVPRQGGNSTEPQPVGRSLLLHNPATGQTQRIILQPTQSPQSQTATPQRPQITLTPQEPQFVQSRFIVQPPQVTQSQTTVSQQPQIIVATAAAQMVAPQQPQAMTVQRPQIASTSLQQAQGQTVAPASSSDAGNCPFCNMQFEKLRSRDFCLHVSAFHMPKLEETNRCDVAGCTFVFASRLHHIQHVSFHTKGNNSLFLAGLVKLHEHYIAPNVWPAVVALEKKPLEFTECPLCKVTITSREPMLHHLTVTHFSNTLAKNIIVKGNKVLCPFFRCRIPFNNERECVLHLGIHHSVVTTLLRDDSEGASNIVCPCCKARINGLTNLAKHMMSEHCKDGLTNEVARLNELKNLPVNMCPVSSCKYVATSLDDLVRSHYSLHGASLDAILSLREMAKMDFLHSLLSSHRKRLVDKEPEICLICKKEKNKNTQFCNEDALMLHVSITHYLTRLRTYYLQFLDGRNGTCLICKTPVKPELRALHAGVVHKEAKRLMLEASRQSNSSTEKSELPKALEAAKASTTSGETKNSSKSSIITCMPVVESETISLESPPPGLPVVDSEDKDEPSLDTNAGYSLGNATLSNGKDCPNNRFDKLEMMLDHLEWEYGHRSQHAYATCFCCNFTQAIDGTEGVDTVKRRMVLHSLSKTHLFNQWRQRFADKNPPERRQVDPIFLDVCEPCGGERVSDFAVHSQTPMHVTNTSAIHDFVAYCDLREICPVTCSPRDVCFFLEISQHSGNDGTVPMKPNRVLNAISRIHDPVGGQELLGVTEIEEKVGKLMFGPADESKGFKFICYSCPFGTNVMRNLLSHCESGIHSQAVKYRTVQKLKNVIQCQPCNKTLSLAAFKVHLDDQGHLSNFSSQNGSGDAKPVSTSPVPVATSPKPPVRKASKPNPASSKPNSTVKPSLVARASSNTFVERPRQSEKDESSHPYSKSLQKAELISAVRCPNCHQSFDHATYLLLHVRKVHRVEPEAFLAPLLRSQRRVTCSYCTRPCGSPLAFALHHDTHQVKKLMRCGDCQRSYLNPNQFYLRDSCGRNNVGEQIKAEINDALSRMVFKKDQHGIIGAAIEGADEIPAGSGIDEDESDGCDVNFRSDADNEENSASVLPKLKNAKVRISKHDKNLADQCIVDMTLEETEPGSKNDEKAVIDSDSDNSAKGPIANKLKRKSRALSPAVLTAGPTTPNIVPRSSSPALPAPVVEPPAKKSKKLNKSDNKESKGVKARSSESAESTASSSSSRSLESTPSLPASTKSTDTTASQVKYYGRGGVSKESFCLDCERCLSPSCRHGDHPRVLVRGTQGDHIQAMDHRRFQPVASFLSLGLRVAVEDAAYSRKQGNSVRKKFKANVMAGVFDVPKQFAKKKKCRVHGCQFQSDMVLEVYRHIRETHLKD